MWTLRTTGLLALLLSRAEAFRASEGCYNAHPVSCQEHNVPLEDIEFDLEEACYKIEDEVFQGPYVTYYRRELHPGEA